jgi:hypothetical protein
VFRRVVLPHPTLPIIATFSQFLNSNVIFFIVSFPVNTYSVGDQTADIFYSLTETCCS